MSYDARTRNRWRAGLNSVTAVVTISTISATGWLAGVTAKDHQAKEARKQAAKDAAYAKWKREKAAWEAEQARNAKPKVIWKTRKYVTRVQTVMVPAGSSQVGGGSVSSSSGSYTAPSSSGGGGGGGSRPAPKPAPAPPPPPAPSSGS